MTKVRLDSNDIPATASPPLHQWDYGQKLEIESKNLPSDIEVHFSCAGKNEAIVQAGTVVFNIATVPIPDICLESGKAIEAWVFEVGKSHGRTIKPITIPVIERPKARGSMQNS